MARDADDLKDLKREFMQLVRLHGDEATEFQRVRQSLLDMNKRHRREAMEIYARAIANVDEKLGGR